MNNETRISVVIPVYREAQNISKVCREVCSVLDIQDMGYEIIFIDDGSTDETWEAIAVEAAKIPLLRALRLSKNYGKESAIFAGLEMAAGDAVIVMDGDLQHPPELLPKMIGLWRSGKVDVVDGIKKDRGCESLAYRLAVKMFYKLFNRLTNLDLERSSDFKLLDRRVVDSLLKMGEINRFFRGMTSWLGYRREQIPFDVGARAGGKSGWSFFKLVRLSLVAVTSFSTLPLHLVTLSGVVFLIFSVLLGVQTLYNKFSGDAVTGFSTVILLLLIIGSFLMISLGIIGEYLAMIYKEVKGRPHYVAMERIGKNPKRTEDKRRVD